MYVNSAVTGIVIGCSLAPSPRRVILFVLAVNSAETGTARSTKVGIIPGTLYGVSQSFGVHVGFNNDPSTRESTEVAFNGTVNWKSEVPLTFLVTAKSPVEFTATEISKPSSFLIYLVEPSVKCAQTHI